MCPIMHERMNEPVLAADGHTYERQAIEKWLQMHNTSPMTGAPLAHRYLTENFALRHIIASYDAVLSNAGLDRCTRGRCGTKGDGGFRPPTSARGGKDAEEQEDEDEEDAEDVEYTEEEEDYFQFTG